MYFLKKKSSQLDYNLNLFNKFFKEISSYLELDNNWSFENAFKNEIIKSFIRGVIRESDIQKKIIDTTLNELKNINYFNNNFFITKVYPMIHMQKDILEAGKYHNDQIGEEKMLTCWIPFTEYDYPALSFVDFKQRKFVLLNKILNKLNLISYFSTNIFVDRNEIYLWDARIFHKGNINLSNNITCAIQFKITSKPFLYERSKKINFNNEPSFSNYKSEIVISNKSEIINNFKDYFELVDNLINIKTDEEFNTEIVGLIKNIKKNKTVSFALSVLSQRLDLLSDLNGKYANYKKYCKYIDLSSLILGSENLISLERIKKSKLFNLFINDGSEELFKYLPQSCYQWNLILNTKKNNIEEHSFSF